MSPNKGVVKTGVGKWGPAFIVFSLDLQAQIARQSRLMVIGFTRIEKDAAADIGRPRKKWGNITGSNNSFIFIFAIFHLRVIGRQTEQFAIAVAVTWFICKFNGARGKL